MDTSMWSRLFFRGPPDGEAVAVARPAAGDGDGFGPGEVLAGEGPGLGHDLLHRASGHLPPWTPAPGPMSTM